MADEIQQVEQKVTASDIVKAAPRGILGIVHTQGKRELAKLSSARFLPRLQLMGSNSDAVKEDKCGKGWALVSGQTYEEYGKEVEVIVLCFRAKAMDLSNKAEPVSIYDTTSNEWADIKARSRGDNSGCMWGTEWLLWLAEGKLAKWCTYFAGNPTARREVPNFDPILDGNNAATLKWQLIANEKFKWEGPIILPCSSPSAYPPEDEMIAHVAEFQNPPLMPVVDKASEEEVRDR